MLKLKKYLLSILFLIILIIMNSLLEFALVPSNITRVILHELEARDDYKYVFLGTSHGLYSLDPEFIDPQLGKKSLNLCMGGEYLQDSYYILKRVFETNHPDTIVLDMDFEYLTNVPKSSISGSSIYREFPFSFTKIEYFKDKLLGFEFRTALFPWMDYRDNLKRNAYVNIIKTKMSDDYRNYSAASVKMNAYNVYKDRGFIYRLRYDHTEKLGHLSWDESKVDQKSLEYLKKIADLCKRKNTRLIMMSAPIPIEQITYTVDKFDQAYTYLAKIARENNIEYYNFNLLKEDIFSRTIQDYNDYDGHMYGDTAAIFSDFLGKFLKNVENDEININDYFYDSVKSLPTISNK